MCRYCDTSSTVITLFDMVTSFNGIIEKFLRLFVITLDRGLDVNDIRLVADSFP